jgi:hypothetical protein
MTIAATSAVRSRFTVLSLPRARPATVPARPNPETDFAARGPDSLREAPYEIAAALDKIKKKQRTSSVTDRGPV